jgi:hypothetical protein
MTVEFLIHAIVHQTTILIAQLATLGGARAPLAQVANQVFLDLVRELERQGVSRKVSADMFGLGLRTYRRKIQRMSESSTERGRSLWEVVLEYIKQRPLVSRADVLVRFSLDDEAQVRAVLRDLCDSQLVVLEDLGGKTCYRTASEEELLELRGTHSDEGYDDLLAALLYREGPLTLAQIAEKAQTEQRFIEAAVERLVSLGRIARSETDGTAQYEVRSLVIPLGAPAGWEAAVFDHYKAMVKTILARLADRSSAQLDDNAGGSTYTIDTWPGHPLNDEVSGALRQVRSSLGDLRARVTEYNREHPRPEQYRRTVIYAGQCLNDEGND